MFLFAFFVACAFLWGRPFSAPAAEVQIPLTVRFDEIRQAFVQQLYTEPDGRATLWHEGSCRYLHLDRPEVSRHGPYLRLTSHGIARVGSEIWGMCFSPFKWQGFVEVLLDPYVTSDWKLRFRIADSNLYDERWQKGLLTGRLWDLLERFFLPRVGELSLDLAPPQQEILSLVRVSVAPSQVARAEMVWQSVRAGQVEVQDPGVRVPLILSVPDVFTQSPLPPGQPEAPLSQAELRRYQEALERWDAFLVFVIKGLGLDITDLKIREDLFELLLISRYELLPALTGPIRRGEGDPVRRAFVQGWEGLREIVLEAQRRALVKGKILRYAAFIQAGDALLALDRAAPGLGIEISADGLRRLARILRPEALEDPVAYSLEVDPTLRTLFGFSPLLEVSFLPDSVPLLLGPALAYAFSKEGKPFAALREQLDRWVPKPSELKDYYPLVDRLLRLVAEERLGEASLEAGYVPVYRSLVPATALQESCWRQFMRRGKKVTYLASQAGSIGLMQINQYVWRGFYDVGKLRWDAVYNSRAGAEILMRYLQKYGVKEGRQTGKLGNAARATWAVYNAGPRALRRYRSPQSSPREKRVDGRFWKIYEGLSRGGKPDLLACTVSLETKQMGKQESGKW